MATAPVATHNASGREASPLKFTLRTKVGAVGFGAIGLVLARPARLTGVEPFFMELIGGIEEAFTGRGLSILLQVVPDQEQEIASYRRWAASGGADAVIVLNMTADDQRPAVLAELGLPAVVVGHWAGEPAFMTVTADDARAITTAAKRLLGLGHRRIAHVTGPATLLHTRRRTAALEEVCAASGAESVTVEGDYTEAAGVRATRHLLALDRPPTAILFDNDVMALGGLMAAETAGVAVPERLSLVAWDDSTACRLARPALTVMAVDVHRYGRIVAAAVLDLLAGAPPSARESPPAHWIERGSTGPAPVD